MKLKLTISILTLLFTLTLYSQEKKLLSSKQKGVEAYPVKIIDNINKELSVSETKNTTWRVYFVWMLNQNGERTQEYYLYRPTKKESSSEVKKQIKILYGHRKYEKRFLYLEKGEIACIYDGKISGDKKNGRLGKYKNISKEDATVKCQSSVDSNHGTNMKIITN